MSDVTRSVCLCAGLTGTLCKTAEPIQLLDCCIRGLQCRINANRGPWQLFARAPLLMRDKDLSQPATRVDTTCWQLFRPAINTAHFYFLFQKLVKLLDY